MIHFEINFQFPIKEKYYFRGNTKLIILTALRALGLTPDYLYDLLALPPTTGKNYFEATQLSAFEWVAICNALYLPLDIVSIGYNRRMHICRILTARDDGYFHLKTNQQIYSIAREINLIKKRNRQFENEHYGFRLRWKVRWQNFKKVLCRKLFPNPQGIDPTAYAQEIARERLAQFPVRSAPQRKRRQTTFIKVRRIVFS